MDLALLHSRAEVRIRERARVLFATLFRQCEDDDGQQRFLPQMAEKVDVEVLVRLMERSGRAAAADWSSCTCGTASLTSTSTSGTALPSLWRRCPRAKPLNGWQAGCLALFVLFPPKGLSGILVALYVRQLPSLYCSF